MEVAKITHVFGKDITGVDDVRDMKDLCTAILMVFADIIFVEVEVFDPFRGDIFIPTGASLIVIVNEGTVGSIEQGTYGTYLLCAPCTAHAGV